MQGSRIRSGSGTRLTVVPRKALGRDRKEEHFSRGVVRKMLDDEEPQHPNPPPGVSPSTLDPSLSTSNLFAADIAITADSPFAPVAASPTDSLPEKERSDLIIRFSLEYALWQHSAVHPDVCVLSLLWDRRRADADPPQLPRRVRRVPRVGGEPREPRQPGLACAVLLDPVHRREAHATERRPRLWHLSRSVWPDSGSVVPALRFLW